MGIREVWVKVDDEPLKVHAEAEMEGGESEAWIARRRQRYVGL